MQFTKQMLEAMLRAKNPKTQTRRLVNEGEIFQEDYEDGIRSHFILTKKNKVKWQIGRDLCVQLGRGKNGLHICVVCKKVAKEIGGIDICMCGVIGQYKTPLAKPLRIEITDLKKQKLLDITEAEAKKEGFKDRYDFLKYVTVLLWHKIPKENKKLTYGDLVKPWNPEVWVISFKVK